MDQSTPPERPPLSLSSLSASPSSRWLALDEMQELLLASYPGTVFGMDLDGRIGWINPAGARRLDYAAEELVDRNVAGTLIGRDELDQRATALAAELGEPVDSGAAVLGERLRRGIASDAHAWNLRHKDGTLLPTRLAVGALRDPQGGLAGLIAVEPAPFGGDADQQPQQLLHHDALTGLPTRSVLSDRAEMAIQRATRQHSVVAMLLIELDGFSALCHEYGRSVGDDLLRATASRLHFELRKTDTAVRFDGGQFTAMLVDLHTAEEARLIADKVRQALSAKVNVGVAIIPLTVRIGVAWFPSHGNQLLPLLETAEASLQSLPEGTAGIACAPTG